MHYDMSSGVVYPKTDLVGVRYYRVTVAAFAGRNVGRGQARWTCVCDCGVIFDTPGYSLGKYTKSCGCLGRELARARVYKHGLCKSQEYRIHAGILQRCYTETYKKYHLYGGRGIRVCDRWRGPCGFENFLSDMGPRPTKEHSVDRIDNDGNYEPENCRWATKREQALNRRATLRIPYNGKIERLIDVCERLGLKYKTVGMRLREGWTVERAIGTPTA